MPYRQASFWLGTLAAFICASGVQAQALQCTGHCTAIVDIDVISMAPGTHVDKGSTVLIGGDRILAIGRSDTLQVPPYYQVINGTGKWLIPGLSDMHMHFLSEPIAELDFTAEQILSPYIAYGVLQVADLAASTYSNDVRDAVKAGKIVAPMMVTAAMVDGVPPIRPGSRTIATPEAARAVVAEIAAQEFDFVKVYSNLDMESFKAVLDAAADAGIGVIGHIPGGRETRPSQAVLPGFNMIAHAEEFAWRSANKSDSDIAVIAGLMAKTGAALTPTLVLNKRIHEQTKLPSVLAEFDGVDMLHPVELMMWFEQNPYISRSSPQRIAQLASVVDFNARLTLALSKAGIPILAGTDAAFIPGLAPGLSLHEELAALVEAGLTPYEALAASTVTPATWLGVIKDRGTIEAGKRANLVLLDANPLDAIENTLAIKGVFLNGRHYDRPALDAMLQALDALYAPYRPYFSPQATSALNRKK
jgi:imidazolonepropionase-like amidohydrolase